MRETCLEAVRRPLASGPGLAGAYEKRRLRGDALAAIALLAALLAFVAWLAKAGAIGNFISEGVMTGFKCGVALFVDTGGINRFTSAADAVGSDAS